MSAPRIGSLFSGTGALDMAVEQVTGGETVWFSENDPAASRVLAHNWPDVPNLGDMTQIDWASLSTRGGDAKGSLADVDIITGGFP